MVGPSLARLLNLSSKRMPTGHYLKDDAPFLEFTDFQRARDESKGTVQPGNMQWSTAEFIRRAEESAAHQSEIMTRMSTEHMAELKRLQAEVEASIDAIAKGAKTEEER